MGIIIAAVITTLSALGIALALYARISDAGLKRAMLVAALVALPLQPLAYYAIRAPLNIQLYNLLGSTDYLYTAVATLYAPLTEEPAKWLVLILPLVRRFLTPQNAVPLALATGFGFGAGEIWFLADEIRRIPMYAGMPFYSFGGFFYERLIVVFLHGAFVMFLFQRIAEGRNVVVGALIGIVLHWLLNLPIFLSAIRPFGIPAEKWTLVALLVQILMVGGLIAVAARFQRDAPRDKTGEA